MKTYTKKQVEEIVKSIIHQDSFGDVHYKANKVAEEQGFDFQDDKQIEVENEEE